MQLGAMQRFNSAVQTFPSVGLPGIDLGLVLLGGIGGQRRSRISPHDRRQAHDLRNALSWFFPYWR